MFNYDMISQGSFKSDKYSTQELWDKKNIVT